MNVQDYYRMNLKWAVVGDVINEEKYAFKILENFKNKGYNVVGVTPYDIAHNIYNTLEEVEENIEGVNLCVAPKKGYEMLLNDKRHNIKCVIAQPGASSEKIRELCIEREIEYFETCTLVTLEPRS
ncbi:MAG: CoA-binding protein [Clostridium sp.]